MKHFIYIILFILSIQVVDAQQTVKISGRDSSYAGDSIRFMTISNHITEKEKFLAGTRVKSSGKFSLTFSLNKPRKCFTYLGTKKAQIILEPSKTYKIGLPEKKEITQAQLRDPYFTPTRVYLDIIEHPENDVNQKVRKFDAFYQDYLGHLSIKKIRNEQIKQPDSAIAAIREKFPPQNSPYFKTHRYYRISYISSFIYDWSASLMLKKFFKNKPFHFHHPVYQTRLNQTLSDYLKNLISKGILDRRYSKNYSLRRFKHHLDTAGLFSNDSLRSYTHLLSLYNGNYQEYFSFKGIMYQLDSITETTEIPEIKSYAKDLRKNIIRLRKGSPAPGFSLYDQDSVEADLSLFRGKFILLTFYSSYSNKAKRQLSLLQALYKKYKKHLEIVTVSVDKQFSKICNIADREEYNWTFLNYRKSSDILEDYRVKDYPVYYLLSPRGKMLLSPAPSPTKNLETKLKKLINKELIRRKREQYKNNQKQEEDSFTPY